MSTIAVVGAGSGLGVQVARRFGREGHQVALVSRSQENVDALAQELVSEGVTAAGFAASVRDPGTLADALKRAEDALGPIEVLQYSPVPQREFLRPVLETSYEDLVGALEFSVLGPFTAVNQVLPGMRDRGKGTILFVNGGTAVRPLPGYAGTSIAFAGESAYARMLHGEVRSDGIHVAQLVVPGPIKVGHPYSDPVLLADRLWDIHTSRHEFRVFSEPMGE